MIPRRVSQTQTHCRRQKKIASDWCTFDSLLPQSISPRIYEMTWASFVSTKRVITIVLTESSRASDALDRALGGKDLLKNRRDIIK